MDKKFLLNKSKVFCMLPWLHVNVAPKGYMFPCCIADSRNPIGHINQMSLAQAANSEQMKQLRLDMLNERENQYCKTCYAQDSGDITPRKASLSVHEHRFDDLVPNTNEDGSLNEFKMHYFDIRFSNICNFKCRTCNSGFSSSWEIEDRKQLKIVDETIEKTNPIKLIDEVVEQIDNTDTFYFAGGEPLITEEHYVVLEELIRRNKTNVSITYNSNVSNFKFKDKDLLALWSKFDNISLSCSIDHYGERAEYIRHGTDWGVVEANLKAVKQLRNVQFSLNTVVNVFNYMTLTEFYQYLIDVGIVNQHSQFNRLYPMFTPEEISAQILPTHLKQIGGNKITEFIPKLKYHDHLQILEFKSIKQWVEEADMWDTYRNMFIEETTKLDNIRGESFVKTFPELASLMD